MPVCTAENVCDPVHVGTMACESAGAPSLRRNVVATQTPLQFSRFILQCFASASFAISEMCLAHLPTDVAKQTQQRN